MKLNKESSLVATLVLFSIFIAKAQNIRESSYFDTKPNINYTELKAGFKNVPKEARMRVWWFWMNGIATIESITQDLEAMKANGIAGAILIDNGADYAPIGPTFMSKEWKELFAHAISEADRLGIEISLNIQSGAGDPGNPNIEDDNGLKETTFYETKVTGPKKLELQLEVPPNQIFYKDIKVQAIRTPDIESSQDELIKNWGVKSFTKKEKWNNELDMYDLNEFYDTYEDKGISVAVKQSEIIDLSPFYEDGRLNWDVPEGKWTIIRYGYTSTGKRNNYASEGFKGGLSYDQMHKRGINAQWDEVVKPLIDIAKANGNSLKYLHVDSWEMKNTNWTHNFISEFKNHRGYDLEPFLPVLAGYIVISREVTNRFLEDFRLTVGDLVADNNYREFRRLAHEAGLSIHSESAGPHMPPVDGLKTLGINDVPMGESWARANTHRKSETRRIHVKLGASAAHIYGKRFFAAETPTSVGPAWERSPADVKNVLDKGFCTGVNRVNWHTYTSSPDEYGIPGIEYFAGTHLNRKATWWDESKVFIDYINRTQHMLTQGLHVADVLGYLGSGVPLFGFLDSDREDIPDGYAWDMCNSDVLLNRATVKDGRIYLPDGKNYAILALPKINNISLPVLRKIEEMVKQGIVLVGDSPERPFGLTDYPASDEEFNLIVEKLWGETNTEDAFKKTYGKGKVYFGKNVEEVLRLESITPDLAWESSENVDLAYIHHTSDKVDVYYVVNKWAWKGVDQLKFIHSVKLPDRYLKANCSFRVKGDRKIERWNPVTGEITEVNIYKRENGSYTLPINLEPEGGAFFVFTKTDKRNHVVSIQKENKIIKEGNTPINVGTSNVFLRDKELEVLNGGEYTLVFSNNKKVNINASGPIDDMKLTGSWKVNFNNHPSLGESFTTSFDQLISWTASEERKIKYFSGSAVYSKSFYVDDLDLRNERAYLNLGKVGDIAVVTLNGKKVCTLWKPPYLTDVTDYIVDGENKLEVSVTNLWINRLVGDQNLSPELRKTQTNLRNVKGSYSFERLEGPDSDKYLRFSGLMGPVKIIFSKLYNID